MADFLDKDEIEETDRSTFDAIEPEQLAVHGFIMESEFVTEGELRTATRDYLDDFVFFAEEMGQRKFSLSVEEIDWYANQFVTSESSNGETEFFTTYELKTDADSNEFYDELYSTGKSLGALAAKNLIKMFAYEVDRTSAKMVVV